MSTDEFQKGVFVICGGSSGIGFAVAQGLYERGARLILVARNPQKLAQAGERLGNKNIETISCDLSRPYASEMMADRIDGPIQGILVNAGGPPSRPLEGVSWQELEAAHALLVAGPMHLLGCLEGKLVEGHGSVVAITSTAVFEPLPGLALSSAYRLALTTLLKEKADGLAPRGIRVNCVAPGFTATDRLDALAQRLVEDLPTEERPLAMADVKREWARRSPLGRIARPDEVAAACLYLFSKQSSFITRQTLVVDGGSLRRFV